MTLSEALLLGACALTFSAPLIPAAVRRLRPAAPVAVDPVPVVEVTMGAWEDEEDEEDDLDDVSADAPPVGRYNMFYRDSSAFSYEPSAPIKPTPPRQPGRQALKMPTERGPFGDSQPWSRPFPDHAHSAAWHSVHRYAPGGDQQRDPRAAFIGQDPPIAMVCPGCELEQTPLRTEGVRGCPYCGLKLRLFGARVFWWREAVQVPEWRP